MIKIERPDVGDFARGYDAAVRGLSSHFVWLNRSKESLTLDLKHPEAKLILDRLLEKADIYLQNLAPGATERLGLVTQEIAQEISASDPVRSFGVWIFRTVPGQEGLRHADSSGGRIDFHHRDGGNSL